MSSKLMRVAATAATLALAAGCASSGPGPRGGGPPLGGDGPRGAFSGGYIARPIALVMVDLDLDGDRRTTLAEAEAGLAAVFEAFDADRSGELSAFEQSALAEALLGAADAPPGRLALDRDMSGRVSEAEFLAAYGEEFSNLDSDGDRVLERDELITVVAPPTAGGGPRGGGPGGGQRPPSGQRPPGGGF